MKTKSLTKAKIGSVKVVLEANTEGYSSLGEIPYDENLLHEVITELRKDTKTNHELILKQDEQIALLNAQNKALEKELFSTNQDVAKLRVAIEETVKGLITR